MIVLDATVLIGHFRGADAHHARADELVAQHLGGGFGASTLTLAEVLVGPTRGGRLAEMWASLHDLGVEQISLPADAPERLAALRAGTGLRLPDCCVLLATQDAAADGLATFDNRLQKAAISVGIATV